MRRWLLSREGTEDAGSGPQADGSRRRANRSQTTPTQRGRAHQADDGEHPLHPFSPEQNAARYLFQPSGDHEIGHRACEDAATTIVGAADQGKENGRFEEGIALAGSAFDQGDAEGYEQHDPHDSGRDEESGGQPQDVKGNQQAQPAASQHPSRSRCKGAVQTGGAERQTQHQTGEYEPDRGIGEWLKSLLEGEKTGQRYQQQEEQRCQLDRDRPGRPQDNRADSHSESLLRGRRKQVKWGRKPDTEQGQREKGGNDLAPGNSAWMRHFRTGPQRHRSQGRTTEPSARRSSAA